MSKKLFQVWKKLKTIDNRESVLKSFKRNNKKLYIIFKKIHIENSIKELCK